MTLQAMTTRELLAERRSTMDSQMACVRTLGERDPKLARVLYRMDRELAKRPDAQRGFAGWTLAEVRS